MSQELVDEILKWAGYGVLCAVIIVMLVLLAIKLFV
jgi:hypothetical protein